MSDLGSIQSPILALPGPQYSFDYSNGIQIGNNRIIIHQEGGQGRGTAWAVWDGATATALYLDSLLKAQPTLQPLWFQKLGHQESSFNQLNFSILELGSGTGLAGLAGASVFQEKTLNNIDVKVVLTDLLEALPALESNVAANPSLEPLIKVAECNWYKPHVDNLTKSIDNNKFNLIIAADCVWLEELVPPFVGALEEIIRKSGSIETHVLLGYQSRSQRVDDLLFGLVKKSFSIVPADMVPGEPDRGKIEISWLRPLPCLF